jgi:hypothetical protein
VTGKNIAPALCPPAPRRELLGIDLVSILLGPGNKLAIERDKRHRNSVRRKGPLARCAAVGAISTKTRTRSLTESALLTKHRSFRFVPQVNTTVRSYGWRSSECPLSETVACPLMARSRRRAPTTEWLGLVANCRKQQVQAT